QYRRAGSLRTRELHPDRPVIRTDVPLAVSGGVLTSRRQSTTEKARDCSRAFSVGGSANEQQLVEAAGRYRLRIDRYRGCSWPTDRKCPPYCSERRPNKYTPEPDTRFPRYSGSLP